MPTLNNLERDRHTILGEIIEAQGEITDDQEALLNIIDQSIQAKYVTYADMVYKKDFQGEINRLKEYKKEIDSTIKKWESTTKYIHQKLHERGQAKVTNSITGQEMYVMPTMAIENTKIDEDKVDKLVGKVELTIDADIWDTIEDIVESTTTDYKLKRKINIGDLTDEQKDEFQTLRPSVKITKTKPKGWSE